jgi:hypothetical protein
MATESLAQGSSRPGAEGYEPKDASVPWVFGIVVFLACSGIVIQALLVGVLHHMVGGPSATDAFSAGRHQKQPAPSGVFPRLQVSPRLDLAQFHAREDEELTNYGWVDRSNGIVRIPIERAMDVVLQKGLPLRTNGVASVGLSPQQLIEKRTSPQTDQGNQK